MMGIEARSGMRHTGGQMKATIVALAILSVVVSAVAVEKWGLDARIRKLTLKFEQMQRKAEKRIPAQLLAQAQGIVLLDRTKAGFIFAFQGGSGVAMVRDPKSGQWGPTAFMKANEASLGVQIGGQQSLVVMLFMTTDATRALMEPNFEFGGEASGTASDVSAGVEGSISAHERTMLIYEDRQGLYGGAVIKGGEISPDPEANLSCYGQALTIRDILLDQKVKPTKPAIELAQAIQEAGARSVMAEIPTPKPQRPYTAPTNAAVDELQLLLSELNANGQTNALKHLDAYLSAMVTSQHTSDAEMTLAVLERLRGYRTTEAIDLLEFQMEGAVRGLSNALAAVPRPERPPGPVQTLQRARNYRAKHARKAGEPRVEERMKGAESLLDRKGSGLDRP